MAPRKGKHATRFSQLCISRGLSTREIARRTGYSHAAVRAWRCGVRVPQWGALTLLAAVVSVPPRRLAKYFQ